MNWNHSETIGLAKPYCALCGGQGMRTDINQEVGPCPCVLRGIFRACYARFRECLIRERTMSKVSLIQCRGRDHRRTYERLVEDYIADFCLVSRRSLTDFEHRLFRCHFLLGADWRLCCRQLKLDKAAFFRVIYKIQQKLGRVFRELEPYGLFPLDEYFAGRIESRTTRVMYLPPPGMWPGDEDDPETCGPLRPPLREAA